MITTYQDAAKSKLCSSESVRNAVTNGILKGDDVVVIWDDDFESWIPDVPTQRVVQFLNQRRFDARTIRKPISESRPVPEMFDHAARQKKNLESATDWIVIPVNTLNLDLLFRTHTGYWDAEPYSEDAHEEYMEILGRGEKLYQLRLGLSDLAYSGKNLHPSKLMTATSVASICRVEEEDVVSGIKDGALNATHYRGVPVIIIDERFDVWEQRVMALTGQAAFGDSAIEIGRALESPLWHLHS